MPFWFPQTIKKVGKQEAIFSGPVISEIVGTGPGTPQTITLIGGVKGDSESTAGVTALNTRKYTKLFLDPQTNTINKQVVLTPLGNFGFDFINYTIPISLDIPLANTAGNSFTLKEKCKVNISYTKNNNFSLWQKNFGFKNITLKPGTYTLTSQGLSPSYPNIVGNQSTINFVSLRSINNVPVGALSRNPLIFTTTFSNNLTSNYFTTIP